MYRTVHQACTTWYTPDVARIEDSTHDTTDDTADDTAEGPKGAANDTPRNLAGGPGHAAARGRTTTSRPGTATRRSAAPARSTPAARGTDGDRRAQLVDAAVAYVAEHGIADLTLRRLGAAIGVSHRMLIHHFGSKEQLLVDVVRTSEQRQRDLLSRLRAEPGLAPAEAARHLWRQLTDPALAGQERLFFELCGQALQGRPEAVPVLEGLVTDWLEPLVAAEVATGTDPGAARSRARLGLATVRGLLLDLLATGDRAGVDAAMEEFLRMYYGTANASDAPTQAHRPT